MRALGVLLALFALAASSPQPADAQVPAYLYKWGSQGGGNGQFNGPIGIAISSDGRVYVADGATSGCRCFRSLVPTLAR